MRIVEDILYFLFPACCDVCGRALMEGERFLCSGCYLALPRTNFHREKDNAVEKLFWGRVKIERATSLFYFRKGSDFQPLLHKLKYEGRGEIGVYLGEVFAAEIMGSVIADVDLILPVPLHPKKKRKRGYNQSMKIAEGMSAVLDIPVERENLIRSVYTDTQTRRNRFERFLNMKDKFEVKDQEKIRSKRVLLVDDVVTTGSTIEACAGVLLESGVGGVVVGTIAVA